MFKAFKPYKKEFDYSYTLGVFLTIELLKNKKENVLAIFLSSQADKNSGALKIRAMAEEANIPVEISDKVIARLSPKENCYAIGVFSKFQTTLEDEKNHVVLVNPMDSGNLGTILRTGLGFGLNDIGVIRPAVDIFDPKTIRASMGAIFSVNFSYFDSYDSYISLFERHYQYPFMLDARVTLHEAGLSIKEPYSLVFGNESSGLPPEFRKYGTSVRIPHSSRIDSLNLSMAVGIACYEFTKNTFK